MNTIFETTKRNCIHDQKDAAQAARFAVERLALGWTDGAIEEQERAARYHRAMRVRLEAVL